MGKALGTLALTALAASCVQPEPTEVAPACGDVTLEEVNALPEPAPTYSALVLYDTQGPWGDLGVLSASMVVNLLGHFPEIEAQMQPVAEYEAGGMHEHDTTFYLGTVYAEPKNPAFLEDFRTTDRTVVWIGQNLWQMTLSADQQFQDRYGFDYIGTGTNEGHGADTTFFQTVHYKGEELVKYFYYDEATETVENDPDVGIVGILDPDAVQVHAEIEHSGKLARIPYVVQSGNLWYVADNPLSFQHETDRYLAFTDLMHDFVGLDHEDTKKAMFRLEDVHPWVAPAALDQVMEVIDGRPWNMALIPVFADPLGVYNQDNEWHFGMNAPEAAPWLERIHLALETGAEVVQHGYTHQLGRAANPFNGVTGTDFEFWDAVNNAPIPGDSYEWAADRVVRGMDLMAEAGIAAWAFEVPHYQASMVDYFAINSEYRTVYHQGIYREFEFELSGEMYGPNDVLAGRTLGRDLSGAKYRALGHRLQSQIYPYPVERDVYGQRVIPENMRNVTPAEMTDVASEVWTVTDMLGAAQANRVNRCGFASFFYHPFIIERPDMVDAGGPLNLQRLVEGVEDLGYEFVQACELSPSVGIPLD